MSPRLSRLARRLPDRLGALTGKDTGADLDSDADPDTTPDVAPAAEGGGAQGHLDGPVEGSLVAAERVTAAGWAAHPRHQVLAVAVVVDGNVVGTALVGGNRPDVADAHPELPHGEGSGWTVDLDLSRVAGRTVTLEAVAILDHPVGRGRWTTFATTTVSVADVGAAPAVAGGCFVERPLSAGPTAVHGLAEALGGVSRVEVFCDGLSAGFARTSLPGRFEDSHQGPESGVAQFECDVDVPAGRAAVTFTAQVTPCRGEQFELRPWSASVEEASPPPRRAERLADVRRRTHELVAVIRGHHAGLGSERVLVVTHDLGLGGGQLYLQDLVLGLIARGVECVVVSHRGGRLVEPLEEAGVPVLVTGSYDASDDEAYEAQVRQIAAFGAVHGCRVALGNTLTAFPGVDAAHLLGLPVVWAIHESFPLRHFWHHAYAGPVSPYVQERAESALAHTQQAVFEATLTQEMYAPLVSRGGCAVLPYGVSFDDIDAYCARVERDQLRADLGFSAQTLVLVCVGMIEPRKAQISIAQAFAGSDTLRGCDVELVLVGAQPGRAYVEALEDLLTEYGDARIRVEPVQQDTYRWYHAADVLVSGSDIESLPRSMIEAMGFARPVASTAVFGIPELVTDGVNGFLCPSRDLNALRAMLERVAKTPAADLEAMGRHARETVRRRHDPEVFADRFRELLVQLDG